MIEAAILAGVTQIIRITFAMVLTIGEE